MTSHILSESQSAVTHYAKPFCHEPVMPKSRQRRAYYGPTGSNGRRGASSALLEVHGRCRRCCMPCLDPLQKRFLSSWLCAWSAV